MKETLAKLFVPLIAAAGGLGGFLVDKNWVTAEEGKEISVLAERTVDSAAGLITALALALVAMGVKRLCGGRVHDDVGENQRGGSGSGGMPLVAALATAGVLCGALPSCRYFDAEAEIRHEDPERGVSVGVVLKPKAKPVAQK